MVLALQDVPETEGLHHLRFSLQHLWRDRDPGAFSDSVHHLEVAENSGSVDERLGPKLVQNGIPSLLASSGITFDHVVYQSDQCHPAGDTNVDSRICDPFDPYVVFVYLAAPPEPPCVAEYSVETLVEHRDARRNRLQLWCVQARVPGEQRITHLLFRHVQGSEHSLKGFSL